MKPDGATCGEGCRGRLLDFMAARGIECTVTVTPPLVAPRYEPLDMVCPHGRMWFMEPTGDQIARWNADGVA